MERGEDNVGHAVSRRMAEAIVETQQVIRGFQRIISKDPELAAESIHGVVESCIVITEAEESLANNPYLAKLPKS
ncbi:hypothetical protein IID22_04295 [Patescibacteria group bacterium]|nr:hypothetical protein [Patescibacteria group bacterium]